MAQPDTRVRSLSIYLIKPEFTDRGDILDEPYAYDNRAVRVDDEILGILYVEPTNPTPPRWVSLFEGYLDLDELDLMSESPRALLLIERKDRYFAVAFGHGRHMLASGVIDQRFGLRTTLNAVDPDRIRSIDRKVIKKVSRQAREQVSRESPIDAFGMDVERDLLRAVTGTPADEELARRLSGRARLAVTARVDLESLPHRLDTFLDLSEQTEYQDAFPWVDNIAEVRDRTLKDTLEAQLVTEIKERRTDKIWLAPPEILDWRYIEGFAYTTENEPNVYAELSLGAYFSERRDPADLRVQHLSRDRIRCIDAETDADRHRWMLKHVIVGEVELDDDFYILNEGEWYRVDSDFALRVNEAIEDIPSISADLPPYHDESEGAYNERVAEQYGEEYALMDEKRIRARSSATPVEFCDLYSQSGCLVHVKHYYSSSELSHLFAQGRVSAELFLSDREFREEVNGELPESHALENSAQPIAPSEYEVAFAVIEPAGRELRLPFFSKVNLRNAVRVLDGFGFDYGLTAIENQDGS